MERGVKIGVAVLALLAVATVLITPNPTDDVQGIVHHLGKLQKLAVLASIPLDALAGMQVRFLVSPESAANPSAPNLVDLVCARLC
jgi:hypothetical protein